MFNSSYHYREINHKKVNDDIVIYLFSFKVTKKQIILVEVEYHKEHPIAIIKFYPKDQRNSEDRFARLTGNGYFGPILMTCINIMLDLYSKNPYLSFGFCGTPKPNEVKKNKTENSQRFRLYKYIMANFFSDVKFQHLEVVKSNLYFLINRDYCDHKPENQGLILSQLKKVYPQETWWDEPLNPAAS